MLARLGNGLRSGRERWGKCLFQCVASSSPDVLVIQRRFWGGEEEEELKACMATFDSGCNSNVGLCILKYLPGNLFVGAGLQLDRLEHDLNLERGKLPHITTVLWFHVFYVL